MNLFLQIDKGRGTLFLNGSGFVGSRLSMFGLRREEIKGTVKKFMDKLYNIKLNSFAYLNV